MNISLPLRDASVQDIQLELLRRTTFNLARIAAEDWAGEIQIYENQDDIDRALGTGRQEYGLIAIWWD